MKKNGFTLAEVLITLAIIGVVATLTLPALMTNTQEQQAKTALKKGINTLTEAAQMNQAIAGFDYASLTVASTNDQDSQSLFGLLSQRASVDFAKSKLAKDIKLSKGTTYGSYQGSGIAGTDNFAVFFRDGSTLMFPPTLISSTTTGDTPGTELQNDGLPYGVTAIYDTNGIKGPNILSNCSATGATGVTTDVEQKGDQTLDEVCTKTTRVIKDQFGVRLRGGFAVPNGPAARWALEN